MQVRNYDSRQYKFDVLVHLKGVPSVDGDFAVCRVKVMAGNCQGAAVRAIRAIRMDLRGRLKAVVTGVRAIDGEGLYAGDATVVDVLRPDNDLYGQTWIVQLPDDASMSPCDAADPWRNIKNHIKEESYRGK